MQGIVAADCFLPRLQPIFLTLLIHYTKLKTLYLLINTGSKNFIENGATSDGSKLKMTYLIIGFIVLSASVFSSSGY